MSKWLCQLPWVTAFGLALVWGMLLLYASGRKLPHETDADLLRQGVAGLVLTVAGSVALAAWAVVAFVL